MLRSLLFFCACLLPFSAMAEKREVLLLVDKSAATLNGRIYVSEFESANVQFEPAKNGEIEYPLQQRPATVYMPMPSTPGMSAGDAASAGMVGGLMAQGIIDAALNAKRQKPIESIREPINTKVLRELFFKTTENALARHDFVVKNKAIAANAMAEILPSVAGLDGPQYGIVIERLAGPIVSISMDDTKPLIMARISLSKINRKRVTTLYTYDVCYLGEAAPDKATAVKYWSENNAERFLKETALGLEKMLDYALTAGAEFEANPESAALLKAEKKADRKEGYEISIFKRDETTAYAKIRPRVILILPLPKDASTAAAAAPAEPAISATPLPAPVAQPAVNK